MKNSFTYVAMLQSRLFIFVLLEYFKQLLVFKLRKSSKKNTLMNERKV